MLCHSFKICAIFSLFQTVPKLLALARVVLHTPDALSYLMARLSANAPGLVHHLLILFVEVMENLTVILVNWKKTLVRVTAILQSHTTGFVNVSQNGISLMLSV